MKTFELKSSNKKTFATILISLGIIVFITSISFLPWIISNDHGTVAVIAVLVVLIFMAAFLRKILAKKYTIQISDTLLEIRKEGKIIASAPVESIVMLKLRQTANSNEFAIYTSAKQSELFQFDAIGQMEIIQNIITELQQYGEYLINNPASKMGDASLWTEYINKNAVKRNAKSHKTVESSIKAKNRKTTFVMVSVVLVILFFTILPFFINPKAFYDRKDDKIFYGSKEVIGVNPDEARGLGYKVIKDSLHVYYKGEILEWADRATFEVIREPFYMDKNGIYYETSGLYSKHKIVPLEGEYDIATFHKIAEFYYKDKNNLYHLDIDILAGNKAPLRKVSVPGLDIETFEHIEHSHYWYKDKNKVYFSTWDELKPCDKIDRNTFEVLSFEVVKDKNHVYYLTRNLKSEDKKATKKDNYAILEGAHAPSFYKIDNKNYADENTEWSIRAEGEEVYTRENVE